jgi:hypothetical protein
VDGKTAIGTNPDVIVESLDRTRRSVGQTPRSARDPLIAPCTYCQLPHLTISARACSSVAHGRGVPRRHSGGACLPQSIATAQARAMRNALLVPGCRQERMRYQPEFFEMSVLKPSSIL